MDKVIKEKGGNRVFQKASRWNALDYTIISDRNRFAIYADNYGKSNEKLTLTFFKVGTRIYPFNQFAILVDNVILENDSIISRQNVEDTSYFLEINPEKTKIRLYREVH